MKSRILITFRLAMAMALMLSIACANHPLENGSETDSMKVEYAFAHSVGDSTAGITWECTTEAQGFVTYGGGSVVSIAPSTLEGRNHTVALTGLSSGTDYVFTAFCGSLERGIALPGTFRTSGTVAEEIRNRGIWLLGGIGQGASLLSAVDLYDPDTSTWYSEVTNVPTPRLYAGIVSHEGLIYVMGGMDAGGTTSNVVEQYNPATNTWATMTAMPQRLQGFVLGVAGPSIYLLGGSTTSNMQTGTLFNTVYEFTPSTSGGTWRTILSNTAIASNVDMAGCAIDGTIFFNTGRFYNDGSAQFSSDAYVPASNTTTTLTEASFTLARHGAAIACYRPLPTDPAPTDANALLVLGGSTLTNLNQPVSAINASNRFDYYAVGPDGGGPNTVTSGSNLPANLYYPAAEISYTQRSLFIFGGATALNVPLSTVYSLSLDNPTGNAWSTVSTQMPRARFGHRAVILSR